MKDQFITAYQFFYGTEKQEAEYIYHISSYDYITFIITCYDRLVIQEHLTA